MANCIRISLSQKDTELIKNLQKTVQSANLNFLLGSGCSFPAIQTLGNVENEIQELIKNGNRVEANKIIFNFLKPFLDSTDLLVNENFDEDHKKTLDYYNPTLLQYREAQDLSSPC